jgi:hypothetical protein
MTFDLFFLFIIPFCYTLIINRNYYNLEFPFDSSILDRPYVDLHLPGYLIIIGELELNWGNQKRSISRS